MNAPSLAVGDLVGPTTRHPPVTNVSNRRESYSVRKRGLADVDVQAFPATVRLRPGQSRTVRLRITARPSATVDRDVTGWLVWRGDRHRVRIPVAVRPTVVAAPRQVAGTGDRRHRLGHAAAPATAAPSSSAAAAWCRRPRHRSR